VFYANIYLTTIIMVADFLVIFTIAMFIFCALKLDDLAYQCGIPVRIGSRGILGIADHLHFYYQNLRDGHRHGYGPHHPPAINILPFITTYLLQRCTILPVLGVPYTLFLCSNTLIITLQQTNHPIPFLHPS